MANKLAVATNVGNQVNQRANFKELVVGAGSTIFKANREGIFTGAVNYSTAPLKWNYLGALYATSGTIAGNFTITGVFQFKVGSTIKSTISCDASNSLIMTTADNIFFFDDATHYIGKAFYASASSYGLEINGGGILQWTSGRSIKDEGSKLYVNGDFDISGSYKRAGSTGVNSISESNVDTFSIEIKGGIITNFQKNS